MRENIVRIAKLPKSMLKFQGSACYVFKAIHLLANVMQGNGSHDGLS